MTAAKRSIQVIGATFGLEENYDRSCPPPADDCLGGLAVRRVAERIGSGLLGRYVPAPPEHPGPPGLVAQAGQQRLIRRGLLGLVRGAAGGPVPGRGRAAAAAGVARLGEQD